MKAKRIEVKDGSIVVPIYEFADGRFCVDAMVGETRKRITRASFAAAQVEARKLITQIASGRSDEVPLTISESEDYRAAKQKLAPFKVSLLTAVEDWIITQHRRSKLIPKHLPDVVEEFLVAKELEGVSRLHLADRQSRLRKFSSSFQRRVDRISRSEVELWLRELGGSRRTASNYRNALLQLFRFARSKDYLPKNEPVVIEDINVGKTGEGEIQIYTPQEMKQLLVAAPDELLLFMVLGAFAGLRSEEIMRLEWKDIRFEQDFIEVSAAKAKTASRRLVPLLPALKAWLFPMKKSIGRVMRFGHNAGLIRARIKFCKTGITVAGEVQAFTWKSNALRHSFASYRLAEMKDAARVALEMGNSPSMLFRNYRELVTEQQAARVVQPHSRHRSSTGGRPPGRGVVDWGFWILKLSIKSVSSLILKRTKCELTLRGWMSPSFTQAFIWVSPTARYLHAPLRSTYPARSPIWPSCCATASVTARASRSSGISRRSTAIS